MSKLDPKLLDPYYLSEEEKKTVLAGIETFFQTAKRNNDSLTLPALAEQMKWTVNWIITYPPTGPLARAIDHAKLKCENWLVDQLFRKNIDKTAATLMLKNHFGYNEKQEITVRKKVNIKDILDAIENA